MTKTIDVHDNYDERIELTGTAREDLIEEALDNSDVATLKDYLEEEGYTYDGDQCGTLDFKTGHSVVLTWCALPFFGEGEGNVANVFYFKEEGVNIAARGRTYDISSTSISTTDYWVEDSEVHSSDPLVSGTRGAICIWPPWVSCPTCPDCLDDCKVCGAAYPGPISGCGPITNNCLR